MMKRFSILVSVAFMSAFTFMSCTEESELIDTEKTSTGGGKNYDFSVDYNGHTLYFNIDTTAVNECYVTHGNKADWVETDKKTGEGYYTYYAGAVDIPSQVTYNGTTYTVSGIGDEAFRATKLTSVSIPSTVKYIGEMAFAQTPLSSITLPSALESIGAIAFWEAELTSITIPSSVKYIDVGSFEYCKDLKEILVEDGNADYTSIDGILYSKDMTALLAYPGGKTGSEFTVESSVDSLAGYAFWGNNYLKSLTIETNVVKLDGFGGGACDNLESLTVRDDNPNYTTIDGVLYNKDTTELLLYPTGKSGYSFTAPSTVRKIKDGAFYECKNLNAITMQDGLTVIQENAFIYCDSLRSVVIPSTAKQIISHGFYECNNLSSITIHVTEPFEIATDAFYAVNDGDSDDNLNHKNATLYVPAGTKSVYENTDYWSLFEHIVEMSE